MVKWNNRGLVGKKTNYQEGKELNSDGKKKNRTNRTPVSSVCLCEEKEEAWAR